MTWMNFENIVKWKKSDTEGHVSYDFIHMRVLSREIYTEGKQISGRLVLGGEWARKGWRRWSQRGNESRRSRAF